MGLSGRIGMPEAREVPTTIPRGPDDLSVFVLNVVMDGGGFRRSVPLATAGTQARLEAYFREWLTDPHHRQAYIGPTQITRLPFLE